MSITSADLQGACREEVMPKAIWNGAVLAKSDRAVNARGVVVPRMDSPSGE